MSIFFDPDAPVILGFVVIVSAILSLIGGIIASAINQRRRERKYRT